MEDDDAITVRYWAGARAAAGVGEELFPAPATVAELRDAAVARHPRGRLDAVLAACSVLVDGRQPGMTAGAARDAFTVEAGSVVEFLPPFAGG